ncbi:MAG: hypothetical protein EOO04_25550 [Chitinophagaceae bacterium]|nr:MAG: hypothetical protein EOO04_25550 [Chitinophagaceae bacterium]
MKLNKSLIWTFIAIVAISAIYRIIPNRPEGFAPQMALALFGGAIIKDKKWAFALPLFSLFISDLLYQVLYISGMTDRQGLYAYQIPMYLCFAAITVFGFLLKKITFVRVAMFGTAGSVLFFLLSNLFVLLGGFGFERPKTFSGLMLCYNDALLFYRDYGIIPGFYGNMLVGDLFFTGVIFGGYYLIRKMFAARESHIGLAN